MFIIPARRIIKRVQAIDDANIEQAADVLMGATCGPVGKRCMVVSVSVPLGDAGDRLTEQLAPRLRALKFGPGPYPESGRYPRIAGIYNTKAES